MPDSKGINLQALWHSRNFYDDAEQLLSRRENGVTGWMVPNPCFPASPGGSILPRKIALFCDRRWQTVSCSCSLGAISQSIIVPTFLK